MPVCPVRCLSLGTAVHSCGTFHGPRLILQQDACRVKVDEDDELQASRRLATTLEAENRQLKGNIFKLQTQLGCLSQNAAAKNTQALLQAKRAASAVTALQAELKVSKARTTTCLNCAASNPGSDRDRVTPAACGGLHAELACVRMESRDFMTKINNTAAAGLRMANALDVETALVSKYEKEMHILKITVSTLQGQLHTCSEAEADAVLRANAACSELKSVKEVLQLFTEGHATSSNLLSAASDRIAATGREKADIQKTVERQYTAGKGLAQALNKLTLTSDSLKAQLAEAKLNIEDLQALLLQAASVSQGNFSGSPSPANRKRRLLMSGDLGWDVSPNKHNGRASPSNTDSQDNTPFNGPGNRCGRQMAFVFTPDS